MDLLECQNILFVTYLLVCYHKRSYNNACVIVGVRVFAVTSLSIWLIIMQIAGNSQMTQFTICCEVHATKTVNFALEVNDEGALKYPTIVIS